MKKCSKGLTELQAQFGNWDSIDTVTEFPCEDPPELFARELHLKLAKS